MAEISCIYAFVAPSGRAYIGSTNKHRKRYDVHHSRLRRGVHHCDGLQSAYNKYGISGLKFEILEECNSCILLEREQWWIDNHQFKSLYNSSMIAGRMDMTPAVRAKLSAAQTGKTHSEETKARLSAFNTGKILSPEHRAKISAAQAGKRFTDEHKAKLSIAHTGKKQSEETIARRVASMKPGKSGVRGVCWNTALGKWIVDTKINGKRCHLGCFATVDEAARALEAEKAKFA